MLAGDADSGNAMENFEDEIAPMVVRPSKPPRLENLEAMGGQAFMPTTKVVNVLCPHCRGKMSVEELKAHMPTCQVVNIYFFFAKQPVCILKSKIFG